MRLFIVSLLAAVILPVFVVAAKEAASCENCGMNFDISPTRLEVTVEMKMGSKTMSHNHIFECMNCSYNALTAKYGDDLTISGVQMLDYQTFGTKNEAMLDGMKAVYLFGVKRMKGTMPPYIAAFASEKDAKAAQKVIGGDLVGGFDSVWELLIEHNSSNSETKQDGGGSSGGGCGDGCGCGG